MLLYGVLEDRAKAGKVNLNIAPSLKRNLKVMSLRIFQDKFK